MLMLWFLVLVPAVALPLAAATLLWRGRLALWFAALWLGWVAVAAALAATGFFQQDEAYANPWIPMVVAGATAVLVLVTRRSTITTAQLAGLQVFRVVGVAFLVALALGELPAIFAIPAGVGDVAVGVVALFVARRLARGAGRRGAVWFNVLGILDLVVAIGLAVLTSLGPTRVIDSEPSSVAATVLPLVLIPTTIVPLALALHVLSLRRLSRPAAVTAPVAHPGGA